MKLTSSRIIFLSKFLLSVSSSILVISHKIFFFHRNFEQHEQFSYLSSLIVFSSFLSNITGAIINVDKIQIHEDNLGKSDERK